MHVIIRSFGLGEWTTGREGGGEGLVEEEGGWDGGGRMGRRGG